MDLKRKAIEGAVVLAKKARNDLVGNANRGLMTPPRTSSLYAPIMLMTGHEGEIYTARFSPCGQYLASAGFDRLIYFWTVYGECENIGVLKGHTGAILELNFSTDGLMFFTCSTDKTVAVWDTEVGVRIRKLRGHQTFVNSVCPTRRGPQYLCSGSDDGTVKMWDARRKGAIRTLQSMYQVTAVGFDDTAEQIYSGGIDNDVKVWDIRKDAVSMVLRGHSDTVTGVRLSPDGSYLLSNAMDNTLRIWDVRPYAPQERCVKIMSGHQHTFEKNLLRCSWSPDGSKVSAGSGDCFVYVWDTTSRRIMYKLPGHTGSVNDLHFHPTEPIRALVVTVLSVSMSSVLSCSSDKQLYLGELEQ